MADEAPPNFGAELKDAFKPVNTWVSNGIAWIADVEEFYRERSVIEKEYSTKLGLLAKRFFEKKSKKTASLSVGDSPLMTPGSLESASMTTWNSLITTTEIVSQEHDKLATEMITKCAETLKVLNSRYETFRIQHEKFEKRLLTDRDAQYSELRKTKAAYDATCKELEGKRVKVEKSFDHGRPKAQKSYDSQMAEMHNVKNTYLITLNVTNAIKEKYYHTDIPDVLSSLQDLNETRVQAMNTVWKLSCNMESAALIRCSDHMKKMHAEIERNLPHLDSLMFIAHNQPQDGWREPPDFFFEPSPIWHDTDDIVVDEAARVWLQNKIAKSQTGLISYRTEVEKRRKDVESMQVKREKARGSSESQAGRTTAEEMDILRNLLNGQEELAAVNSKRVALETEVDTVRQACGDIDKNAHSHKFKSTSFKIPTSCDLCHEKIWGLSAKGMTCKDCGFNCHAKCEMRVAANCPGPLDKTAKKALKDVRQNRGSVSIDKLSELPASNGSSIGVNRSNTVTSVSTNSTATVERSGTVKSTATTSTAATSTAPSASSSKPPARRVLAPPPAAYIAELPADEAVPDGPKAKMLYSYTAGGDGEISVGEGKEVIIVQPDDGGWTKVRNGTVTGLVPTTYVETLGSSSSARTVSSPTSTIDSRRESIIGGKKKGPAVAPKRGAKKLVHVHAIYDYKARTEDEFDMAEGDKFVLIADDDGSGWAEVEKNGVKRMVPANYLEKA
ncbi:hypothetical protein TWF225_007925 [Orbilia oligospora]|uniref:Protein BZZ1 n=1 Tax=Orbilia oligospora TaxID=2813651 RepID=A0A7C8K8A7_ORBOL|nr:hypothetical protein TWF751_012069 [Orbilia oligospora]KAF3178156.1 hypothetical protein TWF225_007925 [Orbilia oligospora]KAF3248422.1 hypothetical protein TWF128_008407 [Orbilia oligospora]KAF3256581.1 hypothetical protein TWF217_006274 [Orbilia oligospora]KAF3279676.1 hypothetical protein TWF132_012081 [Orbilia oligospora]